MLINKIIKMKDNKYKIIIDGDSIITYDNVILENDLLYKKNIDNDTYKKIIIDTNYFDIYNKTVKYILKKMRSEREIKLYLDKFDISEDKKNKIINKLKDIKLINDIEYCKAFINDKIYLSSYGINKIKKELMNENIPISIIEEELKRIDISVFNNRLEKLVLKRIKANKKYSNSYLEQKILNEMINLGYNREDILNILENNMEYNNDILIKEFEKIYNKLKIKYNSFELKTLVKQKLLQKGFSSEDINNLLQQKTED